MSVEFCDTNVLAYAYDTRMPTKRDIALGIVTRLWAEENGALSIQVMQELFMALTRKMAPPLSSSEARDVIRELAEWQVYAPKSGDLLEAIDRAARWQVSFWDAMILTAAREVAAETLWTEDLNDGHVYDGVTVRNPFSS
jgi:predicted nucleic acid-binding protein